MTKVPGLLIHRIPWQDAVTYSWSKYNFTPAVCCYKQPTFKIRSLSFLTSNITHSHLVFAFARQHKHLWSAHFASLWRALCFGFNHLVELHLQQPLHGWTVLASIVYHLNLAYSFWVAYSAHVDPSFCPITFHLSPSFSFTIIFPWFLLRNHTILYPVVKICRLIGIVITANIAASFVIVKDFAIWFSTGKLITN